MELLRIYKLSFPTEKDYQEQKSPLFREIETEEGTITIEKAGIHVIEVGHVKKDPTFDEEGNQLTGQTFDEEGNELTPAEYYSDWAVNVVFDPNPKLGGVDPVYLREFVVKDPPDKWNSTIAGETDEMIVKPL